MPIVRLTAVLLSAAALCCSGCGLLSTPEGELASPQNVSWPESVPSYEINAIGLLTQDSILEETAYGLEVGLSSEFLSRRRLWTGMTVGYHVYPVAVEAWDGEITSVPLTGWVRVALTPTSKDTEAQLWVGAGPEFRFNSTNDTAPGVDVDDCWGARAAIGVRFPEAGGLDVVAGYQHAQGDLRSPAGRWQELDYNAFFATLGFRF
jgi:hypothetical protein